MRLGIDLGTTFSCAAWVDDAGGVRIIPGQDGSPTTPSVVWFDGRRAVVGHRANALKSVMPHQIRELFKRDMGKPVMRPAGLYSADDAAALDIAEYQFDGYSYGAAGISALVLRKIKLDAIRFFRQQGRIDPSIDERQLTLDAVISVPAHFGDLARRDTELAGHAAGLNVIRTINEPTAAALAYGVARTEGRRRVLVFDLGGGTFDLTVLQMEGERDRVLTSLGYVELGGHDWDDLIYGHLSESYRRRTGREVPARREMDVREMAIRAKHDLSEKDSTVVRMSFDSGDVEVRLERSSIDGHEAEDDDQFVFEARATPLLARIRALCQRVLESVLVPSPLGDRPATWSDIDEIVLVGGSCRMPMVRTLVERLSRRSVRTAIEGFDLDTSVAAGAALCSSTRGERMQDVMSHTISVRLRGPDRDYLRPLIRKDTPLPREIHEEYEAGANAYVELFEGESTVPDECVRRGKLELRSAGPVGLWLRADQSGILRVEVEDASRDRKRMEIEHELYAHDERAKQLKERIQRVELDG